MPTWPRFVRFERGRGRNAVRRGAKGDVRRALRRVRRRARAAALVDAVNRAKPSGAKGTYMRTLTVAPTMGPGLRLDIPSALAAASA